MSLWGRIVGALLLLVVVLVSCKDELSTLGFRNPSNKFNVAYKEIDLPTSVLATDSLATYNNPGFTNTQRWLVGEYVDDQFGTITASAYTQIRPLTPTFKLPDDATFVNAELHLTLDFYHYGTIAGGSVAFNVHPLTEILNPFSDDGISARKFYYNTEVRYDPKVIAEFSTYVNPTAFDLYKKGNQEYLSTKDTTKRHIETLVAPVDKQFASELFLLARNGTEDYSVFTEFIQIFKGLALVPTDISEVIIGINPDNDAATLGETKLVLNYTTKDATSGNLVDKQLEFGLFKYAPSGLNPAYQIGFSRIEADRTGTELEGLTKYQDFQPASDLRYIQAGNPIVTKVDFGNFFAFADTIPSLSINSAELVITGIDGSGLKPPDQLTLRVLKDDNRFNKSAAISLAYLNYIAYDKEQVLTFSGDNTEQFTLNLTEKNEQFEYSGFLASYMQLLYSIKTDSIRFKRYGIVPFAPEFQKSVNRVSFNKNNIKLRLYYTTPTSTQQ